MVILAESTDERPAGIIVITKTAIVALIITFVPQGVWLALIVTNLRIAPSVPWAVLTMTVLVVAGAQYLRGAWGPPRTAAVAAGRCGRRSCHARLLHGRGWLAAWR